MAREDFLGIARIDREFALPGMIALASERTIKTNLSTRTMNVKYYVALCRCLLKRGLGLHIIDAAILLFHWGELGGKRGRW